MKYFLLIIGMLAGIILTGCSNCNYTLHSGYPFCAPCVKIRCDHACDYCSYNGPACQACLACIKYENCDKLDHNEKPKTGCIQPCAYKPYNSVSTPPTPKMSPIGYN